MCGDAHRADDVVQIAITRLYAHWRKARAATDPDAYARTVPVRVFLNEHRRRWSLVRLVGRAEELPRPSTHLPDVETREVVWSALRRLSPRVRAALVLRFVADLSVAWPRCVPSDPARTRRSTSHKRSGRGNAVAAPGTRCRRWPPRWWCAWSSRCRPGRCGTGHRNPRRRWTRCGRRCPPGRRAGSRRWPTGRRPTARRSRSGSPTTRTRRAAR
ncbi:hypothetical protein BN6_36700 [Saccharothrix espanaensis DSM 44229]|uniref:RNA polymerase sigma-70 region 2 domain-containing protein n=1 Tax=Saccharothrix espanaensis (strain ATCC 51144 / DSM 44229 / JCM 9112 / NBRC 15066 / NRRL 15764) TaxID=1179773 RepID=K0JT61_SACES|nr:hypothetical protein BN6_36700 [Saccharothrix espanaensis DSM 44229]